MIVIVRRGFTMDAVLKFMREHDIPETRENYLDIAYFGNPPDELSAEEEAELHERFQREAPENFE